MGKDWLFGLDRKNIVGALQGTSEDYRRFVSDYSPLFNNFDCVPPKEARRYYCHLMEIAKKRNEQGDSLPLRAVEILKNKHRRLMVKG